MSDHPIEVAVKKVGVEALSFLALVGLSFAAGVFLDPMDPFRSVTFVLAVAATYFVSIQWGIVQGLFMAAGFLTLLLVSSVFRSQEAFARLVTELPLDIILFATLAILPGLVIEIYSGAIQVLKDSRDELKRKIQALSTRLAEINRQKKSSEPAKLVDEVTLARRASQLAEAVRGIVPARTSAEVVGVLADALKTVFSPKTLVLAQIDAMGAYQVARVVPEKAMAGIPSLDANDVAVREASRAGKAVFVGTPIEVGGVLPVNLLVPVVVNRSLVAVVGLMVDSPDGREEIEFAAVLQQLSGEVIGRFGLPV